MSLQQTGKSQSVVGINDVLCYFVVILALLFWCNWCEWDDYVLWMVLDYSFNIRIQSDSGFFFNQVSCYTRYTICMHFIFQVWPPQCNVECYIWGRIWCSTVGFLCNRTSCNDAIISTSNKLMYTLKNYVYENMSSPSHHSNTIRVHKNVDFVVCE